MLWVVGGHSRNIGKTSVMSSIIRTTAELRWQAIKITQYNNPVCATEGEACDCAPSDPMHPYSLDEQRVADGTDTGRYVAAGAAQSWWLRTAQGDLGHAIPTLRKLISEVPHNIAESNSLLRFFQPDLYIVVVDFANPDIKESSRLFMDRADAFVVVNGGLPVWRGVPERWIASKPRFDVAAPAFWSEALAKFVKDRALTVAAR